MTQPKEGCAPQAKGPILTETETPATPTSGNGSAPRGGLAMQARVGHPAPDFEATAYHAGAFENFKLSDFAGRWVVLCFYPGDFTFV